jgi:hypothetical protein
MSKKLIREYIALCPGGICDITLLTEQERQLRNNGYTILTGVLSTANKKNQNGRIYQKHILERELNNYQKKIKSKTAIGALDHPDSEIVELASAALMIERAWWDGDDILGVIKVLKNTPNGQTLEGLIKDGVQIGISSRALGSVRETPQGVIVEDDLQILCWDAVADPSNIGSYLQLREARLPTEKYFDKAYRINALLNDIIGQ